MTLTVLALLAISPTLSRGVHVGGAEMVDADWRQLFESGFRFAIVDKVPSDAPGFTFLVQLAKAPPTLGAHVLPIVTPAELAEARARYPRQTLVVRFESPDALAKVTDERVIYAFDFHEPRVFTEQGRPGLFGRLRNVPYPSSPRAVSSLLPTLDLDERTQVQRYGTERWDAQRVARSIRNAGFWSRRQRVPVVCFGVGVWGEQVETSHRQRYLTDVVRALREEEIGWCLRGYDDPFGFATGAPGARRIDPSILSALR